MKISWWLDDNLMIGWHLDDNWMTIGWYLDDNFMTILCVSNSSLSNISHHTLAHSKEINNKSTFFQGDDDMHNNIDSYCCVHLDWERQWALLTHCDRHFERHLWDYESSCWCTNGLHLLWGMQSICASACGSIISQVPFKMSITMCE